MATLKENHPLNASWKKGSGQKVMQEGLGWGGLFLTGRALRLSQIMEGAFNSYTDPMSQNGLFLDDLFAGNRLPELT